MNEELLETALVAHDEVCTPACMTRSAHAERLVLTEILRRPGLDCALCIYDQSLTTPRLAVTVIEGYAVCDGHLGYVAQGGRFTSILKVIRNPH